MAKISSLNDLRNLKEKMQGSTGLREKGQNIENLIEVKVSMATCGIASGARETMSGFMKLAEERKMDNVVFTQTGCMGYCHSEPTVEIRRPGEEPVVYGNVKGDRVKEIFEKFIVNGEMVDGIIPVAYRTVDE